jgi:K(+)-stimulated pyrophosphate-energized sodium pump
MTAAIGKGFAISSAFAVVVSQIQTYVKAYGGNSLDLMDSRVSLGLAIGVGLTALFCGLLAKFTIDAAGEMAVECIEQFKDPDIKAGRKLPDSDRCIHISTVNALKKMAWPVAIAIGSVLAIGFSFGPEMVGGTLAGASYCGVPLAIFFSNAGGLADNAKKRFEANLVAGLEKGTPEYIAAHDAAVVGDTIGDWMKDVVATAVDIFLKIMSILALMLAAMFAAYHFLPF